jgi:2-hydroxychromene-2-carboxylate isomerase
MDGKLVSDRGGNMQRTVEFYFDFGSPTTYLAWTQLPKICADAGAKLVYKPILLGGVFQMTGNASPATVPAKGVYMGTDLARFARRYGVPFGFNPYFPINTLTMMRLATGVARSRPADFDLFLGAIFPAMWVDGKNLGSAEVLMETLRASGLPANEIVAMASDPAVKDALKAETENAVARGIFGAPSIFVDDELFFGQDRLDFVREALAAAKHI